VLLSPNVLYQIFQISSVTFYSSVSWAGAFVSPTLSPIPLEFPHILHFILFPPIMASQDASLEVISLLSDDEESKSSRPFAASSYFSLVVTPPALARALR
jgi:hypothetical protein